LVVLTRWAMTQAERKAIAEGEDVFITCLTTDRTIQPMQVQAGPGEYVNLAQGATPDLPDYLVTDQEGAE
jgi:hypothetical protein